MAKTKQTAAGKITAPEKINTATAKAILYEIAHNISLNREKWNNTIKMQIQRSAEYKRFQALQKQIDALVTKRDACEQEIQQKYGKMHRLYISSENINVYRRNPFYDEKLLVSKMLVLSAQGVTVDKIIELMFDQLCEQ